MSKDIDWSNLGFGYVPTDKRFVANFTNGAWDEGALIDDPMVTMSECAGVLQYAQTCFEGLKAYRTEDGKVVQANSSATVTYGSGGGMGGFGFGF